METIEYIRQLPELSENMIHIWGVYVPDILDRVDALRNVLCERERKKAARFRREADRSSSIAARGALRILLSGYTGIPAAEIGFQYSETGKPFIAMDGSEVDFNVSHSNDWVVLAFGRDCNIGVDVEKIKRDTDVIQIASRFFAPEEVALIKQAEDKHAVFFQLWARKEAYVKARGSGLFRGLSSFSVPINGNKLPECGQKDGWYFHRLEAGSKYAAAVVTDRAVAGVPCYDFGGLKWES